MATTRKPARRPRRALRPRASRSNPDWKRLWSDVKRAARKPSAGSAQRKLLDLAYEYVDAHSGDFPHVPGFREHTEQALAHIDAAIHGHDLRSRDGTSGVVAADYFLRSAIRELENSDADRFSIAHTVAANLDDIARPALWAAFGPSAALKALASASKARSTRSNPYRRRY